MSDGALHVEGLSLGYGRTGPVVRDLTLAPIPTGTVVALVGPNGAGKSTLLRGLAGLLPVQTGHLRLGPQDLAHLSLAERASRVAYMPQAIPVGLGLSVLEGVLTALHVAGRADGAARARAMVVLDELDILALALTPLDRLSGGERQLASLAQALAPGPRVLLLDEPTSALDLAHQFRVMEHVRVTAGHTGAIAVVVLHDLTLACRWADRVVVLAKGSLAAEGPPAAAVTPAILRQVYGVEASLTRTGRGHIQVVVDGLVIERECRP